MKKKAITRAISIVILVAAFLLISESIFAIGDAQESGSKSGYTDTGDMPFISWLRPVPRVARDFAHFFLNPREFIATWIANPSTRSSPLAVLTTTLTIIAVLYAIYAAIFRTTPFHRIWPSSPAQVGEDKTPKVPAKPRIIGFSWGRKVIEKSRSLDGQVSGSFEGRSIIGFGGVYPEYGAKGLQDPQIILFDLGLLVMVVADVTPESFTTKSTQLLFHVIFALIATISTFPCAWVLRTTATFGDVFSFTLTASTYCSLFWSLLALLTVLLVTDLLKFDIFKKLQTISNGRQFAVIFGLGCLWNAIMFLPVIRSLYLSYKGLYSADHWSMIVIILGGVLLSVIITPVIFVPFCYVWLKVRGVLEAMN